MGNEKEESPTELNTIKSSGGFMIVSPDKLSIKYTGVGQHGHDVGVAQSNKLAPFKRQAYYCEIYVKDDGVKGRVSIGFTTDNFKTGRHLGWELNTCGYHGEDGLIYLGNRQGEAFGPTYTTGLLSTLGTRSLLWIIVDDLSFLNLQDDSKTNTTHKLLIVFDKNNPTTRTQKPCGGFSLDPA